MHVTHSMSSPRRRGSIATELEECLAVILCEHLRASKDDGDMQLRILRGSPLARLAPQDDATSLRFEGLWVAGTTWRDCAGCTHTHDRHHRA
jgi:hypothetical protein